MTITRRQFLEVCRNSATALGLSAVDLARLERALASPNAPTVIWLQGGACTGCSVSLLNRISSTAPTTIADVLINVINLQYHPNLMAAAGQDAAAIAQQAASGGGFVLAVEGGVPTAFGGATCWAWTLNGADVTFQDAVSSLAAKAAQILCVGTCASWGGIPAAPPNPAGVKGVGAFTGRPTVNIAGCPAHPDWVVWAIAQILAGLAVKLDAYGRPAALFGRTVHDQCPRREREDATTYGQDNRCLEELGCHGPLTMGPCPVSRWNGGANWCCDANTLCIGCTDPKFPFNNLRSRTHGN